MAFEQGAYNPSGQKTTKPSIVQTLFGSTTGTNWTFDAAKDLPSFVAGNAANSAPVYQDEIMRIAQGVQPNPDTYMATDRRDGSEWFAGAMNLVGALVDRNLGAPTETITPAIQPAFFGSSQPAQSSFDPKTLALFAGGAVLVYLLAKAA